MGFVKETIEMKIKEVEEMLNTLKGSRETALVKTKLDEARLWLTQVKEN